MVLLMEEQLALLKVENILFKQTTPAFSQIAELKAIAMVFQLFQNNSFNLYTDRNYIFRALQGLDTVPYIKMSNDQVRNLFQQIQDIFIKENCHSLWSH